MMDKVNFGVLFDPVKTEEVVEEQCENCSEGLE
jgi:hypothetical protein